MVNAQEVSQSRGWRTNIELGALWHAGGAVGPDQPAEGLDQTGFAAGIGIGRFAQNGAGVRLSLRGFEDGGPGNSAPAPCPILADFTSFFGSSSPCGPHPGSFKAVGISVDLASGISPTGLPLGIETGPDMFRTLSRPHNELLNTPPGATLGGWHTTVLLQAGRRSPLELTAGANWLSGGIFTWTFPVGLRFAF